IEIEDFNRDIGQMKAMLASPTVTNQDSESTISNEIPPNKELEDQNSMTNEYNNQVLPKTNARQLGIKKLEDQNNMINEYNNQVLPETIKEMQSRIKELEDQNSKMQSKINEHNNQVLEYPPETINAMQLRIKELEDQNSKMQSKINEHNNQVLEGPSETISAMQLRIEELESTMQRWKTQALKYQSALGNANVGDDISDISKLKKDIIDLKANLANFCILSGSEGINHENGIKLLKKYGITTYDQIKFESLLQAALQKHILETVIERVCYLTENPGCLETKIVNQTNGLLTMLEAFNSSQKGNVNISQNIPTKLRQKIYYMLSNRGFNTLEDREHPFITEIKKEICTTMAQYRTARDHTKFDKLAETLARDIIRIFFCQVHTQEKKVDKLCWFENNEKYNPEYMEGHYNHDNQDLVVEICEFPLISLNKRHEILSLAKVYVRPN
ncbi:22120_t:CDS:2, partial [Gigaspora margarita]